jgi:RHS repeat-associated protein
VTGAPQSVRATLRNSAGNPLANFGVEFTVAGPNATTGSAVTNTSGIAIFTYAGTNPGTDTVTALVRSTATANVNGTPPVPMVWTLTPQSPPVTQGWIGGPLNDASVTGTVPITVGAGVTLTNAKVEYWPATNPAAVTTLVEGAQGGPGATLTTLDTTTLANGNYVIRVTATDSNGLEQISQVIITVTGENKPGRVTLSVRDLTVPLSGLPITIDRQYDSLERNQTGDFGYGWSLEVAGPRLEVNPDNDVTLTEPGTGRRVTFRFNPTSFGFPFSFFYQPTYTAEPGVFGKLTSNGCGLLIRSGTSGFACFLSTDLNYNPTAFAYTDPYGRVYTMTSTGKMVSIKNIDGNVLTFTPNGITSSAGNLTVPFVRDAQGRIEQITDPNGKVFRYTYDALGDLVSVKTPDSAVPLTYEYYAGHFFKKGTDARGNAEATNTYFANGRLESTTDAMGKTTTYSYDLVNNITTITHPDNTGTTIRRFDTNGSLLSETDQLNRSTSYTYDNNRNKLTETDAAQKTTTFTYDTNGHLKSVTDPQNKTVSFVNSSTGLILSATNQLNQVRTFTYDAASNFTGITDQLGNSFSLAYNDKGNPISLTDGTGKTTRLTYDAFGRIIAKVDPIGRTTAYTYDGMGRVLTMTDARGIHRFEYDEIGNLLSIVDPLMNETRYEYDANGNRTAEIDARQNRTSYEYDAANRLIKVTYADNTAMRYTYNFRGQKETQTDQSNRVARYFYDNAGQLVKTIHPNQTEVNITYDEIGRVKTVTNELNKTTTYEYEPNCGCRDRLTKITDADGKVTQFTYDAKGRRISFRDANNNETRYEYDVRDNLLKTIYADNSFATNTYDGHDRLLTATDQEGKLTRYSYDEVGNLTSLTDAKNQTTLHTYDVLNNLLSTTDGMGRATRYEYDALNRKIKRVLPLGMAELYTYDQVGNLATTLDFRGKQTSYEYDALNRLIAKRPDASLGEPAITFTYTPTGRRSTMVDSSGTTTYTYDARDRRLTKQAPQGTLTYTYDAATNLASVRSSNNEGIAVDYGYDNVGRLETVMDQRLGTTTYTYDAAGNLKSESRPNGVRSDYTYNLINRLTNLTSAKSGATQASYLYTLDKTGRRLSEVSHTGRTVNYTYDEVYRLTREAVTGDAANNGAVDYTYDSVGNRLSRISSLAGVLSATSNYDANDRLTSNSYDANGNTRTAEGKSFTYDFENRIRNSNNGAVRLTYDGDGNLVARTAGGITTQYLVDDLSTTHYSQVVEELVEGVVQRQYTYGNSIISQRQNIGGQWMASFYSTDGHGSVRQLTNDAGVVTDSYEYDAFGRLISSTGTTPNVYLYAGERFDADLGLYHLRARHYNPNQGRFMSMDPHKGQINEPISLHKYLYANDDPVNFLDPSGLASFSEYALKVKLIILRVVSALVRLARAIICIFLRAASFLAAMVGLSHWAKIFQLAADYGLKQCPCVPFEGPVYRGGPPTPKNFTPRPGIDKDGLSTFDTPDLAAKPGDKVQVIDPTKLKNLFARKDDSPPGHVTITPKDPSQAGPWADSRPGLDQGGPIHPLTQELLDAVVDQIRLGKCK